MSSSDSCSVFLPFSVTYNLFLIAGHDGISNYCKWAFNITVVRCEGRRFYSPIIRSHSFSESVPLGCELHKCSSILSPHLSETGWLEWVGLGISFLPYRNIEYFLSPLFPVSLALTRVGYFPSPGQLGSDNSPGG